LSSSVAPRKKPTVRELRVATVDDNFSALASTGVNVPGHPVTVLFGDERAHLARGIDARAGGQMRETARDRLNECVADVAHRDDHRDRHASFSGGAVAGRDRGVRRHLHVGVGQDQHVILGAAQSLDALASRRTRLVDVLGHRRGTNETDRRHVFVVEQRVHRGLVTLQHREDTVREDRLPSTTRRGTEDAEGSFSLGFRTKALPHAIAVPHIQSGTMTGKLKGVIPATTPSGWRLEYTSTPREAWAEWPPFKS
jgi:hypothetical protein